VGKQPIRFFDQEHRDYITLADVEDLVLREWFAAAEKLIEDVKFVKQSGTVYAVVQGKDIPATGDPTDISIAYRLSGDRIAIDLDETDPEHPVLLFNNEATGAVRLVRAPDSKPYPFSTVIIPVVQGDTLKLGDFVIAGDPEPTMLGLVQNVTASAYTVLVLAATDLASISQYATSADFPVVGEDISLYIALDTQQAYYWDDAAQEYRCTLNITHANTLSSGAGTAEDPFAVTLNFGSGLEGQASQAVPLSLDIKHGASLAGKGTANSPLVVVLDIDGNPIFNGEVYLGVDNQVLVADKVGSLYARGGGPGAGTLLKTDVINHVLVQTTSTVSNPQPYVYNGQDAYITFIHPFASGHARYILNATGALWREFDGNNVQISETVLATGGFWIPGVIIDSVYSFGTWSPQNYSGFWSVDFDSPYPGGDFPPYEDQYFNPKLVFTIWDYNSLNNTIAKLGTHEADDDRHVTAEEQTLWHSTADGLAAHIVDNTRHITAQERTDWNAKVAAGDLAAEKIARETADNLLQGQITGLSQLGRFLDTVDDYTDLPAIPADLPPLATIGDYITVRADSSHGGANTVWRVKAIDLQNNTVTWVYDHTTSSDMSGKIDKVLEPSGKVGKIPIIDANGMLSGTPIDPASLALDEDLDEHIADNVRHVTAAERTAWNAKANQTALDAEITARSGGDSVNAGAISAVEARVQTLEAKGGAYLGKYDNVAALPGSAGNVGDFALLDSGSAGVPAIYRITGKNAGTNTWTNDLNITKAIIASYTGYTVRENRLITRAEQQAGAFRFVTPKTAFYTFMFHMGTGTGNTQIIHPHIYLYGLPTVDFGTAGVYTPELWGNYDETNSSTSQYNGEASSPAILVPEGTDLHIICEGLYNDSYVPFYLVILEWNSI
jgi:hypothetical protein